MAEQHYTREIADELKSNLLGVGGAVSRETSPPEDPQDGRNQSRPDYVRTVREGSYRDPMYLATLLDRLAPEAVTLPDGTKLRAQTGLKNFLDLVKEARPDLWLAAVSASPPAGGALSQL